MKTIPLYIHIPFCRSKCSYCAFYSSVAYSLSNEKLVIEEIKAQTLFYMKRTGSDSFRTIYIGGGTPSMLSFEGLSSLFHFLSPFINTDLEEFTMECNPEDMTEEFLLFLNESPVDRISLGVQSFNQNVLELSGRAVKVMAIEKAINNIQKLWKGRFSIDIISGLPGQSPEGQKSDIIRAVKSGVDHISCYSLIIEENTPLFKNQELIPTEEDEELMWSICRDYLMDQDFHHYEVSNFSRSGCESLHNLQYWRMNEYIGCGPGAVSMIFNKGIKRINNPHGIQAYLKGEKSLWSTTEETIEPLDFLFENYMMGLRTEEGINRREFSRRFGLYPEFLIKETIKSVKPVHLF
jgi:oxygen-independent coproporphyrinogen-3 oxidase